MKRNIAIVSSLLVLLVTGGTKTSWGADPAVAACVKHFDTEYTVAMNELQGIRHTGRASPELLQKLAAIETHLSQLRTAYHRSGLTINQCQSIGHEVYMVRYKLLQISRRLARISIPTPPPSVQPRPVPIGILPLPGTQPSPAPGPRPLPRVEPAPNAHAIAQCRDQHLRLHAETLQLLHRVRVSRQFSGYWTRLLYSMEARLNQAGRNLLQVGLTMDSCRAIGEQISSEHNMLTWLLSSGPSPLPNAPAIAQCRVQNTWLHTQTMQLLQRVRVSGRIARHELQQLNGRERQLNQLKQGLLRVGLNMPSCDAIGEQIARQHEALVGINTR